MSTSGVTGIQSSSDELLDVHFCPCGHVYKMRRSQITALIGTRQLDDIATGRKLDAPILHSSMCADCQEEADPQERLCALMDLDLLDVDLTQPRRCACGYPATDTSLSSDPTCEDWPGCVAD